MMSGLGPDLALHVDRETATLRAAIACSGLEEIAALGITWVHGDPPVVLDCSAATPSRIDDLAEMWPDGPEGFWYPEDWHGHLPLPPVLSRARSRSGAAARRELRAKGVGVHDVTATVLETLARSLNNDPSLLGVATTPAFFAFATHHDLGETLLDVIQRDASPTAVKWLRDLNLFRFRFSSL